MYLLHNSHIRVGASLVLLGAIWTFFMLPSGVVLPARVSIPTVAPDFWPTICGYTLMVLGAAIAVRAWFGSKSGGQNDVQITDTWDMDLPLREAATRVGAAGAIILAYTLVIETLGMPLASSLAFIALSFLAGERRYVLVISVSLFLPIILFLFFTRAASVPIPLGITEALV